MEYKINKASDDVIENVLLNRNLTFDMIDELLLSDEKNYESPHNYPNIDKAYRRIKKAIDEGVDKIKIVESKSFMYLGSLII